MYSSIMNKTIEIIKRCAIEVFEEIGGEWEEAIYQKAMEVVLREKGLSYENQRILPVSFRGFNVGYGKPDLIVWAEKKGKRIGIVVEIKVDSSIKQGHTVQLKKYIQELKNQVKKGEEIANKGLVINFSKMSSKKLEDVEERGDVQFYVV